ncbi:hypothetical protein HPB51_027844 [Rhipicephalus microplus]|uniref:ATPase AAA-type core domain-containing protein n=1 Tax=Rhipicephalus microplus TaxID=6941 RepID=A0A9J6CYT5_RHIMP|nr:hypothetical protein HPB51_027844 [Rhipicephalus microplus]
MTAWEHLLYFGTLVVLDEPTAGLHTPDAREIWEILMRLRGSVSLFFSTHNMTEADVLADRVVCLSAGIVICNASPTHLKNVYGEWQREFPWQSDLQKVIEVTSPAGEGGVAHDSRYLWLRTSKDINDIESYEVLY